MPICIILSIKGKRDGDNYMYRLMKLPEIFSAIGTLLAAVALVMLFFNRYIGTGIYLALSITAQLIGSYIGVRLDLFSEKGRKLFYGLNGVSTALIIGSFILFKVI